MSFQPAFGRPLSPSFGPLIATGINYIIYDQFTGADGTLLTAHAISPINMPGTSWAYVGGDVNLLKIYSNKARGQTGTFLTVDGCIPGVSDCTINLDVTPAANENLYVGIAFRITDINNFWFTIIQYIGVKFYHRLYEKTSGVQTLRADANTAAALGGSTYTMSVSLAGASLVARFGDVTALNISYVSVVRQTVTKHGIYSYDSITPVDNFAVY